MNKQTQHVLIIGGGFGGIAAALALEKKNNPLIKITLLSNLPHFEYHAALYRVVTGKSPLEVCVPLKRIFSKKKVKLVIDTIHHIDGASKIAKGANGKIYPFDYCVLALGSETAYYDIPGVEQYSFGFKNFSEALRLKKHLHSLFSVVKKEKSHEEKMCILHFIVVGGGASGVELAGELSQYTKKLAASHHIDPALITIDLIEGAQRILPSFPKTVSDTITQRLRFLGINVFTSRPMIKEEMEKITVRGISMNTETVIWTAGIRPNSLYKKIQGLKFDAMGRVEVDEYLRTLAYPSMFVIGDGASTKYSGMAQTAIHDGIIASENIALSMENKILKKYHPKKPYYSVPVGSEWAATLIGPITLYGKTGWFMRRAADLRYFLSILPLKDAIMAFRSGKILSESCEICRQKT